MAFTEGKSNQRNRHEPQIAMGTHSDDFLIRVLGFTKESGASITTDLDIKALTHFFTPLSTEEKFGDIKIGLNARQILHILHTISLIGDERERKKRYIECVGLLSQQMITLMSSISARTGRFERYSGMDDKDFKTIALGLRQDLESEIEFFSQVHDALWCTLALKKFMRQYFIQNPQLLAIASTEPLHDHITTLEKSISRMHSFIAEYDVAASKYKAKLKTRLKKVLL